MTNRTPRRRSENHVTSSVGNAGGFCTSTRFGCGSWRSMRHSAEAQTRGVEEAGHRVAGSGKRAAPQRRRIQAMNA